MKFIFEKGTIWKFSLSREIKILAKKGGGGINFGRFLDILANQMNIWFFEGKMYIEESAKLQ